MTTPLIAPLIPPRARSGGREHGRPAAARRLPVAAAPEVPPVPDDVRYGFGLMDESGRVADRAMIGTLGWQPGDRLTLTAAAGVVIARRDPGGMITMASKPRARAINSPRDRAPGTSAKAPLSMRTSNGPSIPICT
ncbi:MAG TPA: hypothetical protein VF070_00280 [Streptosporangiaceae bacterium]